MQSVGGQTLLNSASDDFVRHIQTHTKEQVINLVSTWTTYTFEDYYSITLPSLLWLAISKILNLAFISINFTGSMSGSYNSQLVGVLENFSSFQNENPCHYLWKTDIELLHSKIRQYSE